MAFINMRAEGFVVIQAVDHMNVIAAVAGNRKADRIRADSQHQLGIILHRGCAGRIFQMQLMRLRFNGFDPGMIDNFHVQLRGHFGGVAQGNLLRRLLAGEGVGQCRFGVVCGVISADHDEFLFGVQLAEFARCGVARHA